ncbi:MAG: hypothetical protein WBM28_18205 [Burkholderiales bacterium]
MPRAPGKSSTKLSQLKAAMRAGEWEVALRIAARFEDLGPHKTAIVRGHEAYTNPRFYRQIGKDPEALKAEGKRALITRYEK